jgi:hypothetical protein
MAKTRTKKTHATKSNISITEPNDHSNSTMDTAQKDDHLFDVLYDAMVVSAGRVDNAAVLPIAPLAEACDLANIQQFSARDPELYEAALKRMEARPHRIKAALKGMVSFVMPHQNDESHGIIEHVVQGLHAISDAMNVAHLSGAHLKGPLKYIGPLAEVTAEVLHNPAGELTEKLVCGTAITFTKESVNIVISAEVAATAGLAANFAATPAAGFATIGFVAVASYKMIQKITAPIEKIAQQACHDAFNRLRQYKQNNVCAVDKNVLPITRISNHTNAVNPAKQFNQYMEYHLAKLEKKSNDSSSNLYQSNLDQQVALANCGLTLSLQKSEQDSVVKNSSTAMMLSNMGFADSVGQRIAKAGNNELIKNTISNIKNLQSAAANSQANIASSFNAVNLPHFHSTPRPTITYTSTMEGQVRLARPHMYSSFQKQLPSSSKFNSGMFYSGGEGGGSSWYCDSNGNCYSVGGGNDCRNSDSGKCTSELKF